MRPQRQVRISPAPPTDCPPPCRMLHCRARRPRRNPAAGLVRVQAGAFMTSPDKIWPDSPLPAGQPSAARNRLVLIVYTCAIFVSALLLFSVQPLFTRMVLPRLGGSPAVWSVAMVFFQSLLLGGYAYAHYLMQLRNRMIPVAVHLGAAGDRAAHAAAVDCRRLGRAAIVGLCVLAAGVVRSLDRAAVLCARGQQSAAAGLVRPHPGIQMLPIHTSSMRPRISAASWRCCPIRCCWSRCSRCARKT